MAPHWGLISLVAVLLNQFFCLLAIYVSLVVKCLCVFAYPLSGLLVKLFMCCLEVLYMCQTGVLSQFEHLCIFFSNRHVTHAEDLN